MAPSAKYRCAACVLLALSGASATRPAIASATVWSPGSAPGPQPRADASSRAGRLSQKETNAPRRDSLAGMAHPSEVADRLAPGAAAQCPPDTRADGVGEEADRAVRQRGVHPAGVRAAGGGPQLAEARVES